MLFANRLSSNVAFKLIKLKQISKTINLSISTSGFRLNDAENLSSIRQLLDCQKQLLQELNRHVQTVLKGPEKKYIEGHIESRLVSELIKVKEDLDELSGLEQSGESAQFAEMIEEECKSLNRRSKQIWDQLIESLSNDELEHIDEVIVEIEHAVGGQESMLFVKDMYEFYSQFALQNGWTIVQNEVKSEPGEC